MKIRSATSSEAGSIAAIYNHFVRTSVVTFERFGFYKAAHLTQVGFKMNHWIDVGYLQLIPENVTVTAAYWSWTSRLMRWSAAVTLRRGGGWKQRFQRRIIDMQICSVGIDLGKTTFHLVALGTAGKVLVKKKFSQKQLMAFTANMQSSLIGLEACSGAHFLGRALKQQGHDVRLIPAQFVKPFVKSNKNDFVDAEAIAEAVERKNMRFVPIKTDDQLDLQAMHRIRDRLVCRRTAVINQIRAFLLERGMVFAQKPAKLKAAMADVLENADNALTLMMRNMIGILWEEWKTVEQQVVELTDRLEQIADNDAGCCCIRQIPGIGPIVATAIVAAIGNGAAFRKGRDFAAWLGLVPRQYSTGGNAKLLGISKRGNIYLRKILIHGARAAAMRIKRDRFPIGAWQQHEIERKRRLRLGSASRYHFPALRR